MYFIVLGGEIVSTNKIARPGTGALNLLIIDWTCESISWKLESRMEFYS